ncbi:hypothetical protein, partial [Sphingobacterium paramultivorum]|uniref:hypothetical protein n=1 Tax=Sphingobacterium paramultivorum TaxID=2886510 RepID=UPI001D0DAACF
YVKMELNSCLATGLLVRSASRSNVAIISLPDPTVPSKRDVLKKKIVEYVRKSLFSFVKFD